MSVCNGGEFFESKEGCRSSMEDVRVDDSDAMEVFGYGKFGTATVLSCFGNILTFAAHAMWSVFAEGTSSAVTEFVESFAPVG